MYLRLVIMMKNTNHLKFLANSIGNPIACNMKHISLYLSAIKTRGYFLICLN